MVKNKNILDEIDIVILCGGLGTRLMPIFPDQPKVLAKIGNVTFLDILIANISSYRPRNIILCIGHLKDHIKRYLDYRHNDHYDHNPDNYNIIFSEEEKPLGTGGALKNAESLIKSDSFIVMNGDSICNIDLREFLNFHIDKDSILSMALVSSKEPRDFGSVILDRLQRIISYQEKVINKNKEVGQPKLEKISGYEYLVNAGIYCMRKDIFSYMPGTDKFSLEYDLFPELVTKNRCFGFIVNGELIDIGTPERYKNAINMIHNK